MKQEYLQLLQDNQVLRDGEKYRIKRLHQKMIDLTKSYEITNLIDLISVASQCQGTYQTICKWVTKQGGTTRKLYTFYDDVQVVCDLRYNVDLCILQYKVNYNTWVDIEDVTSEESIQSVISHLECLVRNFNQIEKDLMNTIVERNDSLLKKIGGK